MNDKQIAISKFYRRQVPNLLLNSGLSVFFQVTKVTLPETKIAPENRVLEKEIPIGNHHF